MISNKCIKEHWLLTTCHIYWSVSMISNSFYVNNSSFVFDTGQEVQMSIDYEPFDKRMTKTSVSGELMTIFSWSWLACLACSKRRVSASSWSESRILMWLHPEERKWKASIPHVANKPLSPRSWSCCFHWLTRNSISIFLFWLDDKTKSHCFIAELGMICCRVNWPLDLRFLSTSLIELSL